MDHFTCRVRPLFARVLNDMRCNMILRSTRDLLLPKLVPGEVRLSDVA